MPTIQELHTLVTTNETKQGANDRITGAEVRTVDNAIIDELASRGAVRVETIEDLIMLPSGETRAAYVTGEGAAYNGVYSLYPSDSNDGVETFASTTAGHVWKRISNFLSPNLTEDREINLQGFSYLLRGESDPLVERKSFNGLPIHKPFVTIPNETKISAGTIIMHGYPGINMIIPDNALDLFPGGMYPSISYLIGDGITNRIINGSGVHWTAGDKHLYICDIRAASGITYASIEVEGNGVASWDKDGNGFYGGNGVTKRSYFGGYVIPTAIVHIAPNKAAPNGAAIKFTSAGSALLTNPEDGALEWDGTNLSITNTALSRKQISLDSFFTANQTMPANRTHDMNNKVLKFANALVLQFESNYSSYDGGVLNCFSMGVNQTNQVTVMGLCAGLGAGGQLHNILGKSISANNMIFMSYNHVGDGNANNFFGLSTFGNALAEFHFNGVNKINGLFDLKEVATDPGNPAAGYGRLYARNDQKLIYRLSSGTTIDLTAPALAANGTPTGSSDASGAVGQVEWDDNFIYIKTSTGWRRAATAAF